MFDKLIEYSIKNKLVVGLATLFLIIWGGYALYQLPIDAVPDITNNQIQIITTASGLAPQEIERLITYPIEIAVSSLPELKEVRSISRFGLSVVTIVVGENVPSDLARQWVTERLIGIQDQIPKKFGTPVLAPASTGLGEIFQYTLEVDPSYAARYGPTELRSIQDWMVKRQLLGTPGVAEVSSFGGWVKQYEIALLPKMLNHYGVSMQDIFTALEENNENTGGAYIEKATNSYFIRGLGLLESIQDIENVAIHSNHGNPLRIKDIATVQYGKAIRYGAMTKDAKGETVGGIVLMLKGANSAKVVKAVKDRLAVVASTLPEGIRIQPYLDRSDLINTAIHTVAKNLVEGGLVVIFVLVLMLGNFRAGLLVASVIPLAMLFAFGMMHVFGVSANLMSLGAIDFGLIVDGAVIIVESIIHRLQIHPLRLENGKTRQTQIDQLVLDQSKRIRQSAAFGEIIIMIVYLPLLTLEGIEGKMFIPMALTVTFAIMGALLLSLTYVPMMSALILRQTVSHRLTLADRLMHLAWRIYKPILDSALRFKIGVLILTSSFLIGSMWILFQMGGEFIPTLEEGDLAVQIDIQPGSSLKQMVKTTTQIERLLIQHFPEVTNVVSKIGTSEIPTDPMAMETADVMILLKDKSEWVTATDRETLSDSMLAILSILPGVNYSFQQPIQMRFNEMMTGAKTDIAILVYGEDLDKLTAIGDLIATSIRSIQGVADIYVEKITGLPQIQVAYLPEKLSYYGISRQEANFVLRSAFAGASAGTIYEGEKQFDLVLRLDTTYRHSIEDIRQLRITTHSNVTMASIPFSAIAEIYFEEGPMQINREKTRRRMTVGLNVRDADIQTVIEKVQHKLAQEVVLPAGYFLEYSGEFENLMQAKNRLLMAVPVAILLILSLLYFTLKSISQTLLIFTAIPLAAIGGILALVLRDMPFSISAGVGFITLSGVAVLNGIVLIGYLNELEQGGMLDPIERIYHATEVRLRPVLMTALVASLGFMPMALSTSGGAEVQRPLATVVIGGLVTSTLLTLLLIPVLYALLYRKQSWLNQKSVITAGGSLLVLMCLIQSVSAQSSVNLQQAIRKGGMGISFPKFSSLRQLTVDDSCQIVLLFQTIYHRSHMPMKEYLRYLIT